VGSRIGISHRFVQFSPSAERGAWRGVPLAGVPKFGLARHIQTSWNTDGGERRHVNTFKTLLIGDLLVPDGLDSARLIIGN
jgi:hypothetical protein